MHVNISGPIIATSHEFSPQKVAELSGNPLLVKYYKFGQNIYISTFYLLSRDNWVYH